MTIKSTYLLLIGAYWILSCDASNKYAVSSINSTLYYSFTLPASDSIAVLQACTEVPEGDHLELFLGLDFELTLDIYKNNKILLYVPKPGLEGIHTKAKFIEVTAFFHDQDSVELSDLAFVDYFQNYRIVDCTGKAVFDANNYFDLRYTREDIYIIPESHRMANPKIIVEQINEDPLMAELRYFLQIDNPTVIRKIDRLRNILVTLELEDGSFLYSSYELSAKRGILPRGQF